METIYVVFFLLCDLCGLCVKENKKTSMMDHTNLPAAGRLADRHYDRKGFHFLFCVSLRSLPILLYSRKRNMPACRRR